MEGTPGARHLGAPPSPAPRASKTCPHTTLVTRGLVKLGGSYDPITQNNTVHEA
ncbi:hypothetical protein PGTUg99_031729 [Puccinia graminis f. sp. tritici]|uniref:Uncharacterized protein n=1 Tax=Puccinia graminis f. sp. tritici TaxID=56615 RepID=A0A5B0S4B5_PUCGR|nr:hypothetical protein PGTUg99_031729 [Puccinia graminis f. sp. tritici]